MGSEMCIRDREVPEEELELVDDDDDDDDEWAEGGEAEAAQGAAGPALLPEGAPRSDGAAPHAKRARLPSTPWRVATRKLVETRMFGQLAVGLIVLNTVLMLCEHHHQPAWLGAQLERANVVLTLCFLAEMVLKHAALGAPRYWADGMNKFDGTIVVLSVFELVVETFHFDLGINTSARRRRRRAPPRTGRRPRHVSC